MFFHFKIFVQSIIFLTVMKLITTETVSQFLIDVFSGRAFLTVFVLIVIVTYAFVNARRISKSAVMTSVPVLFSLSSLGMLYFISSNKQQTAFIILSAAVYYVMHFGLYRLKQYNKDKTAQGIIAAAAFATIFSFYAVTYGIYLNFMVPLWTLMMAFMIVTVLVSYQYFLIVCRDSKIAWRYGFVSGLIMSEVAWVVNFWPFGYLTTAAISLIFYYIFWDLIMSHLLDCLSKKRVLSNIAISVALASVVLLSSRWLPVV